MSKFNREFYVSSTQEIYCYNCEYTNSSVLWTQNADHCPNCGKHYIVTRGLR